MTDFVQTMKDWRRMCKFYSDKSMADGKHGCVDLCPLGHNPACGVIEDALDSDIEVMAKEVAKWAAEHPVVYPTWSEWLVDIGVFPKMMSTIPSKALDAISNGVCKPIPADIAEKLGIEPKEG